MAYARLDSAPSVAASPAAIASAVPAAPSRDFAALFGRLRPQMMALDAYLRAQLDGFEPEIRAMADSCIDTSGKRIRPSLVFFSGWRGEGEVADELVRAAAVVELVHLATLVHDDIMDGAAVRRGRPTAAKEYGPAASVLLGDALFSHALALASQFPTTAVCGAVSAATRRVCAGEIMQTLRRRSAAVTREQYFRVIDLKTAELFRVSCALGASLGGYPAGFAEAAATFGRHLGIAYQIYDDLADFFGSEQRIGKTLGTDLVTGKMTLPLFELLDRLPAGDAAGLRAEIAGEHPAQAALRVRQMHELGVFGPVAGAVQREIDHGLAALEPWSDEPPVTGLRQLTAVLQAQVAVLAP